MLPRSNGERQDKRPSREGDNDYRPSLFGNIFQGFYDRFRGVPLRYFDVFIGLCVAAIAIIIVVGVLQARGIL